jgi:hypothetical protein
MDYEKRKKKYIIAAAVIVGLALLGIIIWLIVKYTRKDKNGGGSNDDDPCNDHPCLPSQNCYPTPGSPSGYICSPTAHPDPCVGIDCGPHGDCVKGTCECKDGWTGTECKTPPAKPGANNYLCNTENTCVPDPHGTYKNESDCNSNCKDPDPQPKGEPLFGYWYTNYCAQSAENGCPVLQQNSALVKSANKQWGCINLQPPSAVAMPHVGDTPKKLYTLDSMLSIINEAHPPASEKYVENAVASLGPGTPLLSQTMTKDDWTKPGNEISKPDACSQCSTQSCNYWDPVKQAEFPVGPAQCGYHEYESYSRLLCNDGRKGVMSLKAKELATKNKKTPANIMNIGGWGSFFNEYAHNTPFAWTEDNIPDDPQTLIGPMNDGGYNGISFDIEGIVPDAKNDLINKLNKCCKDLADDDNVKYVWIVIPGDNVSNQYGGPLPFGTDDGTIDNPTVNINNITHVQLMCYGAGQDSIYGGDFSKCYKSPSPNGDVPIQDSCKNKLKRYGYDDWAKTINSPALKAVPRDKMMTAWSFDNTYADYNDIKDILTKIWKIAQGGLFVWCRQQEATYNWQSDDGWAQCNDGGGGGGGGGVGGGGGGGDSCNNLSESDCRKLSFCTWGKWDPNSTCVCTGWPTATFTPCPPKDLRRGGPGMGRTM